MVLIAVLTAMLSATIFALGAAVLISWQLENSARIRQFRLAAGGLPTAVKLRASVRELLGSRIDRSKWGKSFAEQLLRADLTFSPSEYLMLLAGAAIVLAIVVAIFFSLNALLDLIIGALLAWLLSRFYLEARRDRYLTLLAAQIPDVALLISNSLKAGLAAPQAFEVIADKMARPAGIEFKRLVQEIRLGTPADEAMQRMMERFPCEELSLLMTTIIIQRRAGGNLARALAVVSSAIAMRHRVRNEIATLTAEARFTSLVILLIPIFTLAVLNQILPGAVTDFMSNILGFIVTLVFIGVLAVAFMAINRIAKVRV